MKSVLISIQPKWCELIVNGKKTIEVRKTRPKIETQFKVYIYCTKDKRLCAKFNKGEECYGTFLESDVFVRKNCWINGCIVDGKVIGEFVCDKIEKFVVGSLACDDVEQKACISYREICDYFYGKNYDNTVRIGYGWHISDLVIYDKPKKLSEFFTPMGKRPSYMIERPPQSWCYVAELEEQK